jgi:hypothetical protein
MTVKPKKSDAIEGKAIEGELGFVFVPIQAVDRHDFIESWQAGQTKIPVDAEYQGEQLSFERNCLLLKFAHSSFAPVAFGTVISDFEEGG